MTRPSGFRFRQVSVLVITAAMMAGCAESPLSPSPSSSLAVDSAPPSLSSLKRPMVQSAGGVPAIAGTWNGSAVVQLTLPEWVAQFVVGIPPEGPITHVRCTTSGTMTLVQTGDRFHGSQQRQPNRWQTRGGTVYEDPKGEVLVVDGRIDGRSIEFIIQDGLLSCPQRGVISLADDGTANQMSGTARCIVPGHPQSEAPPPFDFAPPPLGTSKVLEWQAWR